MSFTIQAAGRIPDVIEQVRAHESYDIDTSQMEAVRALILAELEAWPQPGALRGVLVEASGHHDSTTSRSVNITIRPLHLKG